MPVTVVATMVPVPELVVTVIFTPDSGVEPVSVTNPVSVPGFGVSVALRTVVCPDAIDVPSVNVE